VDGHGVSAWIAVDPVPEGGSLELVAGSHRGPWLMPRTFLTRQARWFPEGSLAAVTLRATPRRGVHDASSPSRERTGCGPR
jgi:ectoine hydroxylase-related dioxygenase (phytanoyl-CoA dioxygenase family)